MSDALEVARTARALTGAGRPAEALVLTTPLAALADAPTALLSAHAAAPNATGPGADPPPGYPQGAQPARRRLDPTGG